MQAGLINTSPVASRKLINILHKLNHKQAENVVWPLYLPLFKPATDCCSGIVVLENNLLNGQ